MVAELQTYACVRTTAAKYNWKFWQWQLQLWKTIMSRQPNHQAFGKSCPFWWLFILPFFFSPYNFLKKGPGEEAGTGQKGTANEKDHHLPKSLQEFTQQKQWLLRLPYELLGIHGFGFHSRRYVHPKMQFPNCHYCKWWFGLICFFKFFRKQFTLV